MAGHPDAIGTLGHPPCPPRAILRDPTAPTSDTGSKFVIDVIQCKHAHKLLLVRVSCECIPHGFPILVAGRHAHPMAFVPAAGRNSGWRSMGIGQFIASIPHRNIPPGRRTFAGLCEWSPQTCVSIVPSRASTNGGGIPGFRCLPCFGIRRTGMRAVKGFPSSPPRIKYYYQYKRFC